MKPLFISLNKRTPINYLRLILGVIMMAATIYIYFFSAITRFQPYQLVLLFLFGVYYAIMGAGLNLISLIFKRYINIDDEGITVKPGLFKTKTTAKWSDISEIQINVTAIRIKLSDGDYQFEYQHLEEDTIHKLKTAIIHQAKEQGITIG
ncbi:MAG: EbsA family protein [Bacteroidales bacterium]|nr:EbsA family protein [Bacteroidales bacterium]